MSWQCWPKGWRRWPAALAAAITAADTDLDSPSHIRGTWACISARVCLCIGLQLQLKGSDALRVSAAAKMLLLAGRAALLAVADAARQSPNAYMGRAAAALDIHLSMQLPGMRGCMALVDACGRPDAKAVFAATTAAPGALLLALRTCPSGANTAAEGSLEADALLAPTHTNHRLLYRACAKKLVAFASCLQVRQKAQQITPRCSSSHTSSSCW